MVLKLGPQFGPGRQRVLANLGLFTVAELRAAIDEGWLRHEPEIGKVGLAKLAKLIDGRPPEEALDLGTEKIIRTPDESIDWPFLNSLRMHDLWELAQAKKVKGIHVTMGKAQVRNVVAKHFGLT